MAKDPKDRTYRDRYYIWEYEHYKKDSHRIEDYDEGEEVEIYDGTALANKMKSRMAFDKDFPENGLENVVSIFWPASSSRAYRRSKNPYRYVLYL